MRIAAVSSDGENIDLHLGKGNSVYIYECGDKIEFVEKREISIDNDSKHQGSKVIEKCRDCDVIISLQYGFKAKINAEDLGIKLVEDEGNIEDALNRYIKHVKFMSG